MLSRKKKKKHSVCENLQIFPPFLLSCDRSFPRLWKGKTSMYSFSRRLLPPGTTSAANVYACAESILWVIKQQNAQWNQHILIVLNTIDRCIERYIDKCPYRYIDLCLDRYIGEVSVKHRWSIGEVSMNANYIDRYECRSIYRSTPHWYIYRYSTEYRPCSGRYSTDTWLTVGRDVDRYRDRYIGRCPP